MATLLCGHYMSLIRLMRAGDIESNPGPKDDSSDRIRYQKMFLDLSRKITPSSYTGFGLSLEFEYAELANAEKKHQLDTKEALMEILCTWKDRQPPGTDIISVLSEKLSECNLSSLADTISCYSQLPESSKSESLLTKEEVEQIKEELKEYYRLSRRRVTVDPLNFTESVNLDEIYTDLRLKDRSGKHKTPITYEDILTRDDDKRLSKRILIQGEGGVGKTTLCSKIAWDWCNGRILQELDMVLVIPLRDVSDDVTIGGIVEKYLSDSSVATPSQIDYYISRNQNKVLLVLDGFDEFSMTIEKQSSSEVIRILRLELYKMCKVIVTTRPWKKHEFTTKKSLAEAYTFITVEGFDKDDLQDYIRKYFRIGEKDALAEDLISFMEDNDVIQSKMAPFPIYCAMLCLMWEDTSEEKRRELLRLQTFSQIFENMISFLKEHYASKPSEHLTTKDPVENVREAGKAIEDIGEIALEGLFNTTLKFPEERFDKCRDAMDKCCTVGVLTMEKNIISRRRRRREVNISSFVESTVSFPHQLFQEYIAGVYIKNLFDEDRSKYASLKEKILPKHEQFRYLLYFCSGLGEELGLDITKDLTKCADKNFCVDVAFECCTAEATATVGKLWKVYEISDDMSDHTKSGMVFMVQNNQMESLLIERVLDKGRTVSRELAEGMCSSRVLRSVEIMKSECHDDFFKILAAEAPNCQIQSLMLYLTILDIDDPYSPSVGEDLARCVSTMPRLSSFSVYCRILPEEFFSIVAASSSSCQIQELTLYVSDVNDTDHLCSSLSEIGLDLARWVCTMPRLSLFIVDGVCLPEEFFSAAVKSVSSCQIQDLRLDLDALRDIDDQRSSSSEIGENLAQWVCSLPRLSRFSVEGVGLPEEFFSTAATSGSSCQIRELVHDFGGNPFSQPEAANLAEFLCRMPHLARADFKCSDDLPETFFTTLASLAAGSGVNLENITVNGMPSNELLIVNQEGVTQRHSDNGSPECTRRRETGQGSGQENFPAPNESEMRKDEPVLQEMVPREDQEIQEGIHQEGEQDKQENKVEPSE